MMAPQIKQASDWTNEHIARFWAWYGANPHLQATYFANSYGSNIARFLQIVGLHGGRVLDYGCGPGYLANHLVSAGLECWGVDSSATAVSATNARLGGAARWHGAQLATSLPTPFPDESFDLVVCVEMLEHLRDAELSAVLNDIHRLLRPGGAAFFTTPNAENLDREQAYCPFCEAQFHRVQHFRSLTAHDLGELLNTAGFTVEFCGALDFGVFGDLPNLRPLDECSLRKVRAWLYAQSLLLRDRLRPRPFPHGRVFQYLLSAPNHPHLCAVALK